MQQDEKKQELLKRLLAEIQDCIRQANEDLQGISGWLVTNVVGDDVLPRKIPEPASTLVGNLGRGLSRIDSCAAELKSDLISGLANKGFRALNGHPLTEEEYHLLSSWAPGWPTAKGLGLSPVSDFEAY